MSFCAELKRRNVLRGGALYLGAVWALAQGISQLGPSVGAPDWVTRWFLVAAGIGFPFAMLFSWFYEWTPHGIVRESEVAPHESITHSTGRKLDFAIIGVLSIAVVLLLTNQFVAHKEAGAIPDQSIAVLPLANESGDKDQQYFSDGLSEDLINALSQFHGLKVINRNSSFQFRDSKDDVKIIAAKLGVAHLLEGSVRRVGEEVRISAELVNAADGSTLWSQAYDRPYKDLFALQDAITRSVAGALKAKLLDSGGAVLQSDHPPSGNLDAYDAYMQGRASVERGSEADEILAIQQFSTAIHLDPNYAAAYAAMSQAWARLAGFFLSVADKPHAYAQARSAADAALRLDPDLALAHAAKGSVLLNADFDWKGTQAEYRRALEIAPESGLALFSLSTSQASLGHVESAVELARSALARNPLNAFWQEWLAGYLGALDRLDEAEATARKGVMWSTQQPLSYRELTFIEVLKGDAAAALLAAKAVPPGRNQNIGMAWALQIGPDHAAADAALENLIAKNAGDSSYQIAEVYSLRHDQDNMFKWLEKAWDNRDDGIQYLLFDPVILRYKSDPRFEAFCKKVGLPTTTEAKALP